MLDNLLFVFFVVMLVLTVLVCIFCLCLKLFGGEDDEYASDAYRRECSDSDGEYDDFDSEDIQAGEGGTGKEGGK